MIVLYLCIIAASFAGGQMLRRYIEKTKDAPRASCEPQKPQESEGKECAAGAACRCSCRCRGLIIRRYSRNSGAIMNVAEKKAKAVTIFAVVIFIAVAVWFCLLIPKKGFRLLKSGIALMLGGALGNIYERIRKGYVTDYFSFSFLKKVIFNINDMFIIAGALLAMAGL